jgi:hypothetical protein
MIEPTTTEFTTIKLPTIEELQLEDMTSSTAGQLVLEYYRTYFKLNQDKNALESILEKNLRYFIYNCNRVYTLANWKFDPNSNDEDNIPQIRTIRIGNYRRNIVSDTKMADDLEEKIKTLNQSISKIETEIDKLTVFDPTLKFDSQDDHYYTYYKLKKEQQTLYKERDTITENSEEACCAVNSIDNCLYDCNDYIHAELFPEISRVRKDYQLQRISQNEDKKKALQQKIDDLNTRISNIANMIK